ncbi:MAG: ribonuclease domain-containing protein [Bacilli bacterium]
MPLVFILTLTVFSSCAPAASSSETSFSSSSTSETTSTSESTSNSEDHGEPPSGEYRLSPIASESDTGYVYDQDGDIVKEIFREQFYTDLEDVAAYIATFNDVPDNYFLTDERNGYTQSKKECYDLYENTCRIYPGPYPGNYDYLPYSKDNTYHEADIGGYGYAESSSWNRGALRVIFTLAGIDEYGANIPVVFYTDDHYDHFIEYKNYQGGWGAPFGLNGVSWSSIITWY